jgi:hypothetical protein
MDDVAGMGDMRNMYKILSRRPKDKRLFRRIKHTWEDNIRMDFREIGW